MVAAVLQDLEVESKGVLQGTEHVQEQGGTNGQWVGHDIASHSENLRRKIILDKKKKGKDKKGKKSCGSIRSVIDIVMENL